MSANKSDKIVWWKGENEMKNATIPPPHLHLSFPLTFISFPSTLSSPFLSLSLSITFFFFSLCRFIFLNHLLLLLISATLLPPLSVSPHSRITFFMLSNKWSRHTFIPTYSNRVIRGITGYLDVFNRLYISFCGELPIWGSSKNQL
jgi:hypothetical protein